LSDDRHLNESFKFPQRRLSTSTRFSFASQNLEHAELCKFLFIFHCCVFFFLHSVDHILLFSGFQSLENCSFISPQKKITDICETTLELNKSIDTETNYENKSEICKNEILLNTSNQYSTNKYNLSNNFNK